jgi:hypothetical protein
MVAALAFANGGGHGGPGGPGPGDRGQGAEVTIGSDGTLYVETETAATTTTAATRTIKAISSSGVTLWTKTLDAAGEVTLSGSNLIAVANTQATTTTAASSKLTAYSTASGAQAWTLTLDGVTTDLRPFSGGTYAFVSKPSATAGALPTRSVVAISNSGAILWTAVL